jgi:hypothetical protein
MKKEEKKFVTKGTDELMWGWKLPPVSLSGYVARKYYLKYGIEDKGVTITENKPFR